MTLILTELTPFGITMAADSSVTFTNMKTGLRYAQPNLAQKLQAVPHLNAGISCWGIGEISGVPTDRWIANLIEASGSLKSLKDFAEKIAGELNLQVPKNTTGKNRLGFHLAAFEDHNGIPIPSFYHIHDGPSTTLEQRGINVDPNQFNANHDIPPNVYLEIMKTGKTWITRNGDYQFYANMFGLLEGLFQQLRPLGVVIPNSQNLNDRAEYLVFQRLKRYQKFIV